MVLFKQKWLNSGKVVVFGQKSLFSGKVVVFGQNWLYSSKNSFIRAILGKNGCIRARWLYSGKSGFYSSKSGCIRAKVVELLQSCCIRTKVYLFGQKWL